LLINKKILKDKKKNTLKYKNTEKIREQDIATEQVSIEYVTV